MGQENGEKVQTRTMGGVVIFGNKRKRKGHTETSAFVRARAYI